LPDPPFLPGLLHAATRRAAAPPVPADWHHRPAPPRAETFVFAPLDGPVLGPLDDAPAADAPQDDTEPDAFALPEPDADALRAEGYAQGHAAARAEADAEIAALTEQVRQLEAEAESGLRRLEAFATTAAEQLRAAWETAVRTREPLLTELALSVAETVLAAPLTDDQRQGVFHVLAVAIDDLAVRAPVLVQLHPVDLLALQECGLAETLSATHPELRWETTASLDEGDWRASTDEAAVLRIRTEMLASLRERLDLPVVP
jgi:hypothetical protein